jgi:CRP-like cAMP-binding protein
MAERFPRLWENALAIASEYLTLYVSMHVALTSQNAYGRLSEILLNLAATIGRPAGSGFELEISGEELANAANVTLFTASRFVAQSQRAGALTKTRGKILLHSPERLSPEK